MTDADQAKQAEQDKAEVDRARAALLKRVNAFPELSSHGRVVTQDLRRSGPEVAVEILQGFHLRVTAAEEKLAYAAIARLLSAGRAFPYEFHQTVYRLARERGYVSVALTLLDLPARRNVPTGSWAGAGAPEGDMTLGERRWKARLHNRDALLRLARDGDMSVVRNLLQNPRIGALDVVQIAAARPAKAQVLEYLAQHPTWSTEHPVQVALVSNPYTPTRVALAFLPLLNRQEIGEIRNDPSVHRVLSEAAAHLWQLRTRRKEAP